MTDMTDRPNSERQRQAEALANAQIPGLNPENEAGEVVSSTPKRDIIDVSGAPVEPPTDEEIERITQDVIGQLKSVYDPEIPTCLLYTSPSPRDKRQSRMPSSA